MVLEVGNAQSSSSSTTENTPVSTVSTQNDISSTSGDTAPSRIPKKADCVTQMSLDTINSEDIRYYSGFINDTPIKLIGIILPDNGTPNVYSYEGYYVYQDKSVCIDTWQYSFTSGGRFSAEIRKEDALQDTYKLVGYGCIDNKRSVCPVEVGSAETGAPTNANFRFDNVQPFDIGSYLKIADASVSVHVNIETGETLSVERHGA